MAPKAGRWSKWLFCPLIDKNYFASPWQKTSCPNRLREGTSTESVQGEQRRYRLLADNQGGRRIAPGSLEENHQEEKSTEIWSALNVPYLGLEQWNFQGPKGKGL